VSLKVLPARVRAHLYVFWVGMAVAGLGLAGFILSFWQVGSASAAAVDVHRDVPYLAYASIAAWLVGLVLMWYGRRKVNAAVAAKLKEDREAMYVEFGVTDAGDAAPEMTEDTAPDGRDA
jgi:hypothetical protein